MYISIFNYFLNNQEHNSRETLTLGFDEGNKFKPNYFLAKMNLFKINEYIKICNSLRIYIFICRSPKQI